MFEAESFLLSLSYLGIFLGMILLGVSGVFPPSKLLYVVAGAFVSQGNLTLSYIIISGGIGHTIGNMIQYELAKKYGISIIQKFMMLQEKQINAFQKTFNRNPIRWLFIGKLVDPIKLFIAACAGVARTNWLLTAFFMLIGSLIWAGIFTTIGFYFGKSYENFGYIGIVAFIIGLSVMFYFQKLMDKEIVDDVKKLGKKKSKK